MYNSVQQLCAKTFKIFLKIISLHHRRPVVANMTQMTSNVRIKKIIAL